MTIETATETEHGFYVDHYGRCFCNDCADRSKGDTTWHALGYYDLHIDPQPITCDGCERPLTQCPPRVYHGTAVVEHVPCKIF